jgi:glycosyltransferase involved in cell wall biosynthesis
MSATAFQREKQSAQVEKPAVLVLLATYNGERFLREQIDSILYQSYGHQSYGAVRVLARDDGSRDGTAAILAEYARREPERFRVLAADAATGNAKFNFRKLMEAAVQDGARYVACADQDDVWLPEKLAVEMEAMHRLEAAHEAGTPLLVFSDLRVVNADLSLRQGSLWAHQGIDPERVHSFARMLTQNAVTGCTMLLNHELAALGAEMPDEARMHDWWVALAASVFGAVGVVRTPTVLYRQHDANVFGAGEAVVRNSLVPRWRYHDKRREQWEQGVGNAEGMLRVYGAAMHAQKRRVLRAFLRCEHSPHRLERAWLFLRYGFFFNTLRGNLAMLWYLWDMNYAKRGEGPR